MNLLIIDDEPLVRRFLDTTLQAAGYTIAMAADSITGLPLAMREKPNLILLDIGLPGGDGMVILQKIRSNPALSGIPVIIISGKNPADFQERAYRAGVAAYFGKPLKTAPLLEAIRKAIG